MANTAQESDEGIKSMQLYCNIDRIWNELNELGYSRETTDVISVATMNKFDCYDYSDAKDILKVFSLTDESHVLDLGSGLGGPARFLSHSTGASVTGVELQADVATLGNELSTLCGIQNKVHIVAGDFTDPNVVLTPGNDSYDAAVCILMILHVPMQARSALFKRCYELLKPGGKLYIEDFYQKSESGFSTDEKELLMQEVSVPSGALPSREEYISQVEAVGFSDIDFQDVSAEWTTFTSDRLNVWRDQQERHERVHNHATWQSLDTFYGAVVSLFKEGNLGGVKLTITKK
jgi:cyclopropane fatty-acyl-phospholipid synthase-like methyltransferase